MPRLSIRPFSLLPKGIAVVQTSDDPQTVAALQKHASEVSDFVQKGMTALHTAMMKRGMMGGGMMPGPMMMQRMMHQGPVRGQIFHRNETGRSLFALAATFIAPATWSSGSSTKSSSVVE
jgi:hypothetical protein